MREAVFERTGEYIRIALIVMKTKLSIREYFSLDKKFIIPSYQRGYKWGIAGKDGKTAAQILVRDIKSAMQRNQASQYFIQGITCYENTNNDLILIDGQQRTTTILLLLATILENDVDRKELLFKGKELKLKYDIRTSSHDFLEKYCKKKSVDEYKDTQDIYYFKKAIESMELQLDKIEIEDFCKFLLDQTFLFVITVDESEATNVFSMMNGNKAFMTCDELVKADFLCKTSNIHQATANPTPINSVEEALAVLKEQIRQENADEWENNASRSRMSREWDKWLYWWNRPEVRRFYRCGKDMMGHLLKYFCIVSNSKIAYTNDINVLTDTFEQFQSFFLTQHPEDVDNRVKMNFERLRKLQKRFEDIYNDYKTYNRLGFLLQILQSEEREEAILYFLGKQHTLDDYDRYVKFKMVGATAQEIEAYDTTAQESIKGKVLDAYNVLKSNNLYNYDDKKLYAFRYLYYKNIVESDKRKQQFEFFYWDKEDKDFRSMWDAHSLEHIWPKFKVSEAPSSTKSVLSEDLENEGVSQHCLGNLVYLHRKDNSKFKDRTPEEKKDIYFNLDEKIYSRSLLHTMAAFGGKQWNIENVPSIIKQNYDLEISKIRELYGIEDEQ